MAAADHILFESWTIHSTVMILTSMCVPLVAVYLAQQCSWEITHTYYYLESGPLLKKSLMKSWRRSLHKLGYRL